MCSRENLKNKIARFSHPPDVKKTTMHNCTRTIELLCSTSVYSSISNIASPVMVFKGKSIALLFMLLYCRSYSFYSNRCLDWIIGKIAYDTQMFLNLG